MKVLQFDRKVAHTEKLRERMTAIVEKVVANWKSDLDIDFSVLYEYRGTFAWHVRPNGTHMVLLDGDPETIEQQREWLDCLRREYSKGSDEVNPKYRLYLGDTESQELKRLNRFDQVVFRECVR